MNSLNHQIKTRILIPYSIIRFCQSFVISLFLPIITLLQIEKGCSLLDVGVTAGIYSGTVLILELPTGNLADLIGRKIVFIISLVFFLLSGIVFLLSETIINFGIGFMFFGIYRAMASGSIEAWFVDELHILDKNINLQEKIAFTHTFASIGGILGSVLCGIIPVTFGVFLNSNFELSLYAGNLIILILVNVFLFFYVAISVPEKAVERNLKGKSKHYKNLCRYIIDTVKYGIKNKILFAMLIAMFIWGFSFSGIEFFWQPKIQNLMGSEYRIWILSIVSTAYYIFGMIGHMVITRICILFKNNYLKILFFIRLLFGLTLILLALQKSLVNFIILFLCLNLLASMHGSPHKSILNSLIDSGRRSSILSLESLFMELGGLLGVFFTGVVADYFSINSAWFICGIVFMMSGFIYLRFYRKKYE